MQKNVKNKKLECHICLVSLIKAGMCSDWLRDATGLPPVLEIIDAFLS